MASEGDADQAAMLRGILESVATGELARSGGSAESVAQLLAAAIAQVGQSILTAQGAPNGEPSTNETAGQVDIETANEEEANFSFNPQDSSVQLQELESGELEDAGIVSTVEIPTSQKPKPICVKFPIELRKQIIAMRKEGKKCKDIAKELKISVSGAQKVWERFLATGTAHDRKPSSYAGRPRKYTYSQDPSSTPGYEAQYLGDGSVEVFQNQIEYIPTSSTSATTSLPDAATTVVINTGDSEVFTDDPLSAPGAMVEIVDTEPLSGTSPRGHKPVKKKGAPAYREQLLLRLIEACPLATLREMSGTESNPHIRNIPASINKPLYMEYVLGHPFGKVPSPRPFEADPVESQVILSDPCGPVGKELLAALGYSTKVYFNACCKPSPLFNEQKLLSHLPISIGPGHLAETMRAVLQLLLDLCQDPLAALERLPNGSGPPVVAHTADGGITSHGFPPPTKLSDYWSQLYKYASLLQCCENFLSATLPSVPCLLCHPFESFVQRLEVKDPPPDTTSFPSPSHQHSSTPLPSSVPLPQDATKAQSRWEESHLTIDGQFELPTCSEPPVSVVAITTSSTSSPAALVKDVPTQPSGTVVFSSSEDAHMIIQSVETGSRVSVQSIANQVGPIAQAPVPCDQDAASSQVQKSDGQVVLEGSEPGLERDGLHSSITVKLDHPYSGSPWKKREEQEQRGERRDGEQDRVESLEQQQKEEGEEEANASAGDSPQMVRRSSRKKATQTKKTSRESVKSPADSKLTKGASAASPTKTRSSTRSGGVRGRAKRTVPTSEAEEPFTSPPRAKRTRRMDQTTLAQVESGSGGAEILEKSPYEWGVEEVAEFIHSIPHIDCTEVFKEHEVDGESMLSLNPERMVKLMDLKTGPALRIYNKITALKEQFGILHM